MKRALPGKLALVMLCLVISARLGRSSYNDAVARFEGGDSYSVMNQNGSSALGKYQITAGTWEGLGYLSYQGRGSQSDYANYSFTDKARAAGVGSVSDLRYSPAGAALQDRANGELATRNWSAMSARARSLVGQRVDGLVITEDGMLQAAHFLGVEGFNTWVASGFDAGSLPREYLAANGFHSSAQLQAYLMKRMSVGAGNSALAEARGASPYTQTSSFPGIGNLRRVLIEERPPFQGEKGTL